MSISPQAQIWWGVVIILIILIICTTIMFVHSNPYEISMRMDNNTLEAIKSINWTQVRS